MTTAIPDDDLAGWAASLAPSSLPPAISERAGLLLLDAVASALFGVLAQERANVAALTLDLMGDGASSVIGGGPRSQLGAAFLNGFEVTGATMCDVHRPTMTHVTPEVLPATIAVAEAIDAPGAAVLTAFALGLETTIRVALALDDESFRARRWHNPGVAGPFGAAAAAGRLLDLDARAMSMAFGHAGGQAGGTFAALGTAGVKFHQARGAMSGLLAATLAARGMDAAARPFTGDGGLLHTYAGGGHPHELAKDLGTLWHLDDLSLRRWPGSSSTQAVIGAALTMIADASVNDPVEVEVRLPTTSYDLGATAGWDDQLSAMQSPRWIAAVVLTDRAWGPDQIAPARLEDEQVGTLARERVHVIRDDTLTPSGAVVTVRLGDGRSLTEHVAHPLGSPERPLARRDIVDKLRAGTANLGWDDRADAIVHAIDDLPAAPSIKPLMRLLADPERDARP